MSILRAETLSVRLGDKAVLNGVGAAFAPGLVTAIVVDADTQALLMVAHMNADAIEATRATGQAHFWSRSRGSLWKKGETSGHMLAVRDIRIDCDQDAVWVKAVPAGPTCHTGARSCFFRRVGADGLMAVDAAD